MALPTNRKLNIDDVKTNFKDYNFLIFTKMGTIDTTDYNACKLWSSAGAFGGETNINSYALIKTKTDKKITSVTNPDIYEKILIIYENKGTVQGTNTITNIIVKSKRNFLGNQYKNTEII